VTSDAVAHEATSAVRGTSTEGDRWTRRGARLLAARCVLLLAALLTALGISLLIACAIDDRTIGESRGDAVAAVIDTSFTRTVVRFTSVDGRVEIPQNGVLYPAGLQRGQFVRVEYDTRNPGLVRVAGRTVAVALLPVLSSLAAVWVIMGGCYWLIRRPLAGRRHPGAPERT
jgi:hypothetical protein